MKRLKGKFKNDRCFYPRRTFWVIPLFPLLFGYEHERRRIYRADDELIIEIAENGAGGSILYAFLRHGKVNNIIRFKQIED